ncbi:MAG: PAS domain-containing protein [Alphaproteobacteria bacterium]|nr:PAS domain-containing protein [Alphaproteobacteria bacterium]
MRAAQVTPETLFERLQATWDNARHGRTMPRRQDIDAVKLGGLLPYVGLIDVIHGEQIDLRYRLVGAQTTQSFGFNLTGHAHSELTAGRGLTTHFYDACKRCVETRQPQTIEIKDGRNRKDLPFSVSARIWPLSDDDDKVTCLLGGAIFQTPEPAAPSPNAA